ncbi:MAG: hypothetical protein ACREJ0_24530 [Geminicoccaceae bacterium]
MPETIVRPAPAGSGLSEEAAPPPSAADVIARALRTIDIGQLGAVSGTAGSLGVDRIELGEATIDRLVIQGVAASIQAGTTWLQDVRFVLELRLSVDWWYDFGWLGSGGGTVGLPSLRFGLTLGNILVPSLDDINLSVPSAVVNDAGAAIAPITNLNLGAARFRDLRVDDTQLPSAGFGLSGMDLGAVAVDNVGFPAAVSRRLSLGELTPDGPLRLPAAEVTGIEIPLGADPQRGLAGRHRHRGRAGDAARRQPQPRPVRLHLLGRAGVRHPHRPADADRRHRRRLDRAPAAGGRARAGDDPRRQDGRSAARAADRQPDLGLSSTNGDTRDGQAD